MATKISWCDETINPVVGCSKISAGCQNCYAENMASRLACMGFAQYQDVIGVERNGVIKGEWNGLTAFIPSELEKPYRWKRPRSIFISSMGDLFHESVPFEWIDQVLVKVWDIPRHTFIILTKRPERMLKYFRQLPDNDKALSIFVKNRNGIIPNLAIGVSVENQQTADERIPILRKIPAAKIFVSLEPMLGAVDLGLTCIRCGHLTDAECPGSDYACRMIRPLDGVILGGESAKTPRQLMMPWIRAVRDQCKYAGVPFMFKQWHKWQGKKCDIPLENGFPLLDGRTHTELPW